MKLTEIRKIIKISQEMGLKRIKIDTFEAEFFEAKPMVGVPEMTHSVTDLMPKPELADEAEMLFWSSGGLEDEEPAKQ